MEIVVFQPEQQVQVIEFIRQIWQQRGQTLSSDGFEADIFRITEAYCGGRFWLALDDCEIVGTIGIEKLSCETAMLRRWYVAGNQRQSGIGYRLIHTALGYVHSQPFEQVWLTTRRESKYAHEQFLRLGFEWRQHLPLAYTRELYMELKL